MPDPSSSARASGWEWARTILLCATLLFTTLALGGFLGGARSVAAALTASLLAAHLLDPRSGTRAHPAGWIFAPFLAYAAANAACVTPAPWLGWADWFNWAQALAVFWVVLNGVEPDACRRLLIVLLAALGVLASALAVYQHFFRQDWIMLGLKQASQYIGRSSGPFGNPNMMGALMALLIPPAGALALGRQRPRWIRAAFALVVAALAAGLVLSVSRGAMIALAAAFALRPLLAPGRSAGRRIAAAAAATLAALAAGAVLYVAFPEARLRALALITETGERTRPIVWRGAWRIFEDHPFHGGGAGSFDILFERYRPEGFRDRPLYAHCDYLNTLCDYGAVGFALFFAAAGAVAWRGARAAGLAGAAFTGLLAVSLHMLIDFPLKIPALAMVVATVAALVAREAWPAPAKAGTATGRARLAAAAVAVAAVAAVAYWVVPRDEAEGVRYAARSVIDRLAKSGDDAALHGGELAGVRSRLSRAIALDPLNAQAWSDRAYAESLLSLASPARTGELGADAARDAGRATALCPWVAEFWIREGTGLDMQGRWLEGGDCYVRALQIAPSRADVWYYQAYHLSLSPTEIGPAMAAASVCLRLDPGFLLAQLLRQRLETRLHSHP